MMDGAAPPPLYISGRQKTTRSGPEERCVLQALAEQKRSKLFNKKRELDCSATIRQLDGRTEDYPRHLLSIIMCNLLISVMQIGH